MQVTRDLMEDALEYLASTDAEYASARALHNGLLQQRSTIKAMAFMRTSQGPQTQKEHEAAMHFMYKEHLQKIEDAEYAMLTLQNTRRTKEILIDCWRSLNAARNRGQIV